MAEQFFAVESGDGIPTPALNHALSELVPELIRFAWRELAAGHAASGEYLAALEDQGALHYPYMGDQDAVAVVNTAQHAHFVEFGRDGFHLPSRWGSGKGKWKSGRNGLYAHVPFVVTTPYSRGGGPTSERRRTAMPAKVYAAANSLQRGERLGAMGPRRTRPYAAYRQKFTDPGSQLALNTAPLEGVPSYTWKSRQFEGLFNGGEKRTPGGGTQSVYLTIRTIKPDSEGWFIPPMVGFHFAQRALDEVAPQIREILDSAAAEDVAAAFESAIGGFDEVS